VLVKVERLGLASVLGLKLVKPWVLERRVSELVLEFVKEWGLVSLWVKLLVLL
jgi:hypothetical protein